MTDDTFYDDQLIQDINQMISQSEILWKSNQNQDSLNMSLQALDKAKLIHYKKGIANACRAVGTVYSIQSNYPLAERYLTEALRYYDEDNDVFGLIKCHSNLGIILSGQGDNLTSLEHFYKAIDLSEKNNETKLLGEQFLNIGSVYNKLKDNEKAYEYYKKAYAIKRQIGDELGQASVFNNIANLKRNKNDFVLALGYYKKALHIWDKYSFKRGLAVVLSNISNILLEKGEYEKTISYIERQINISIELNLNKTLCTAFIHLGAIYVHKEKFDIALDYFNNAKKLVYEIKDTEMELFYLKKMAEYYEATRNYQEAYETTNKIICLKDKLYEERISDRMAQIETNFRIKEKEQEKELYRLRNVELVNAFKEIEIQQEKLSIANSKLISLDKSKDAILRIVSHDLKNIIGSISSVVDLLRFEEMNTKVEVYVDVIEQSVKKALQMLKDLLEANTIEMDDFCLDLFDSEIHEIMRSFLHSFKIACQPKQIDIQMMSAEKALWVKLDADRFWQVISNLVYNAIKFTPRNGIIKIIISHIESMCQIEIQDTGIGISEEMLPYIFEKFTKAKRKGTEGEMTFGLGLSIVKRLIELHKGSISVNSSEGKGTSFIIQLPLVELPS